MNCRHLTWKPRTPVAMLLKEGWLPNSHSLNAGAWDLIPHRHTHQCLVSLGMASSSYLTPSFYNHPVSHGAHHFRPAIAGNEVGKWQVWGQPKQLSKTLAQVRFKRTRIQLSGKALTACTAPWVQSSVPQRNGGAEGGEEGKGRGQERRKGGGGRDGMREGTERNLYHGILLEENGLNPKHSRHYPGRKLITYQWQQISATETV